jgi:hypothetical protein
MVWCSGCTLLGGTALWQLAACQLTSTHTAAAAVVVAASLARAGIQMLPSGTCTSRIRAPDACCNAAMQLVLPQPPLLLLLHLDTSTPYGGCRSTLVQAYHTHT